MGASPTLFIIILTYVVPLEQVDAAIPEHVRWLRQGFGQGIFLATGRRLPRTGGIRDIISARKRTEH